MKKKRLLSILLTLTMIFSCITSLLPVNAAVDFNGTDGGSYATPGSGGYDPDWGMSGLSKRFGYRVSMYFAPQKIENDQYVYTADGDPVWDWDLMEQVGRTIDIKESPMLYNEKTPKKPYRWGINSAKEYARNGGAYGHKYISKNIETNTNDYYYYTFTNDDAWERDNKETSYMCAILNKDVLTDDGCLKRVDQGVLDKKYNEVLKEIQNLKNSTGDANVINVCDEQIEILTKSYFAVENVNELELPIVNNKPELKKNEQPKYSYTKDLQYYLINPTIIELLADAMGANMSAVDFYLGCWDGPNGDKNKPSLEKNYTHGIFKLVVENMIIQNYNRIVSTLTARDIIALQPTFGKNNNFVNNLVSSYASVFNTIKLTKPEKGFLQVNDEWCMGGLLENGGTPVDFPESEIPNMHHYYDIDKSVGNYMGLGVISSNSILARADKASEKTYQSQLGIYFIGNKELNSGIENTAHKNIVHQAILQDGGKEYAGAVIKIIEDLSKENTERGKALKFFITDSDSKKVYEEFKQNIYKDMQQFSNLTYRGSLNPASAVIARLYIDAGSTDAISNYFNDVKSIDNLLKEYSYLKGKHINYDNFADKYNMYRDGVEFNEDGSMVHTDEFDLLVGAAQHFVVESIVVDVSKKLSELTTKIILSLVGYSDFKLSDTPGVVDELTRVSNATHNTIFEKESSGAKSTKELYKMSTSGKIGNLIGDASSGGKVLIKLPKLQVMLYNSKINGTDVIRKLSNTLNEKIGYTIENNEPLIFDTKSNKYILGENKEYIELNTTNYKSKIWTEDILNKVILSVKNEGQIITDVDNAIRSDITPENIFGAIGSAGMEMYKALATSRAELAGVNIDIAKEPEELSQSMPSYFDTGGNLFNNLLSSKENIIGTYSMTRQYQSNEENKSTLKNEGLMYGIYNSIDNSKWDGTSIGNVGINKQLGVWVNYYVNEPKYNTISAKRIKDADDLLLELSQYMCIEPSTSAIRVTYEEDGSAEYSGTSVVNNLVIDNGCGITVKYLMKDKSGKIDVAGSRQLEDAVSRFNSVNVLECLGATGRAIKLGGKTYKVTAMSKIPYKMSEKAFLNTLETNMGSINTSAETEYTFGDVRVVTGNEYITNALVYPTAEELKDSAEINVYCVLEEVEAPKLIVVYEDENENHERTCIDNPVVTDNKVTVPDIAGYDILAGYISIQEPVGGNTETTTWTDIVSTCDPYDGQWISGKGPHTIEVTPTESQFIYVRARKPLVTSTPPAPGDYTLSQQTISKQFKTKGVLTNKLKDALVYFDNSHHIWYCSSMMCSGHKCSIGTSSSGNYNLKYVVDNETDKKVVAYNAGTSNTENSTGSRKWDRRWDSMSTIYPNYNFVAWRGYDKPVAASYANDSTKLNDVYSVFGIGSGKERNLSELNTSYNKPIKFNWGIGSGSSTSVNFLCSEGYYHGGSVGIHSSSIKSADANVAVNVFESSKSAQTATNSSPALTTIGGVAMTSVGTATVAGAGISFYPYVDMKYQKLNGGTQSLNVLSKYKSVINPINTVDYGFKAGANGSLAVTSSMWSTHQRAVQAKGAGNSLVGGAMYKLGNGNASMLPQMGITTYQWYVPNDATGAVVSGASMTQAKAEQAHQDAVNSLKAAVTGKQIVQKLQPNCTGGTLNVSPGMQASWLSGDASVRLTTNTTQETKKYWFNNVPLKTKIMDTSATLRDYYRINSDTNGNIYLVHGSTVDHTFDKNATNDYILSNMSAEWKEINNKTGLVSTYLKSVIRNKGNDASYGVSGGTWYNEAFPGLCVVKQQTTFSIGMDTAGKPALDNVVDLRLVAGGTQSKADIFKKFNKSFFNVDSFNTAFTFKGSSVPVSGVSLNLRSKDFFIPNATVYDND